MFKGPDISAWQGDIKWRDILKKQSFDFVMLRAGYGKGNVDKYFYNNIEQLNILNIPVGVYWFSYAYSADMAKKEAEYCINVIKKYKISYPVCFDFEYDSYIYFVNQTGRYPTKSELVSIATAFLETIEKAGYYAMNYTNIDYLNKGFSELQNRFDTWLAQWSVNNPSRKCGIWQYTDKFYMDGIGNIDMNISYYDYTQFYNHDAPPKNPYKVPDSYYKAAVDCIFGKYGNGSEREKALEDAGFKYDDVQEIINEIIAALN